MVTSTILLHALRHLAARALFAVCLSLGAALCPAQPDDITLEFWDFPHMPETLAYLDGALREFEQQNPGVKVRYTRLPWQDGQQKVTLAVLSGEPPDVCGQVSNNISQFVAQDVLEPLNDALAPELEDFHPSYLDAVSFNNTIYSVPWYKACYMLVLNLDVFDKFGVKPPDNGRWTWDEFLASMKATTGMAPPTDYRLHAGSSAPAAALVKHYGLVTNVGAGEYESYSIMFNFGGRVLQKNAEGDIVCTVDEAPFVTGLRHLQALDFEHGVAVPGIGAFTQVASWSLWKESATVAASFQGGWVVAAMQKSREQQLAANKRLEEAGRPQEARREFRWSVAAPPTIDAETTPVLASSGLGTFVVFKKKDERRRALAIKLALHLVRGKGQEVLRHECVYPSRISAGNPFADDPMLGPVFALFPAAVLTPLVPGGERIDRVLQQEIQRALLRGGDGKPQVTVEEATRNGASKIEAVLERARRRFGRDD